MQGYVMLEEAAYRIGPYRLERIDSFEALGALVGPLSAQAQTLGVAHSSVYRMGEHMLGADHFCAYALYDTSAHDGLLAIVYLDAYASVLRIYGQNAPDGYVLADLQRTLDTYFKPFQEARRALYEMDRLSNPDEL